jgi:hypothetical protein
VEEKAMPLNDFTENTFVAYLDISGFKELMKKDSAWKALDVFYSSGYHSLQRNRIVEGFFVSDCGVLFVRANEHYGRLLIDNLIALLNVIKEINRKMAEHDLMLRTSIAYGSFTYRNRIEFTGIEKNPIYGNAYLSAVLDNEETRPKIEPTQCRIVKKNLPLRIEQFGQDNPITELIMERRNDSEHYYFYWMLNSAEKVNAFETLFQDSYQLKYAGLLNAAKTFAFNPENLNEFHH